MRLEDLPPELRQELNRLSDDQRLDELDGVLAVGLAARLIAAGLESPGVLELASVLPAETTRADTELLVRQVLRALGLPYREEGEAPHPEVTFVDVEVRLMALCEGAADPGPAARWAAEFVCREIPPVVEEPVWQALVALAGADVRVSEAEYLYGRDDYCAWLTELRAADGSQA